MQYFREKIIEIKRIKDLIILKLPYSGEVLPGQFFMLGNDRAPALLNRPFSVSDFSENIITFRIRITGKFTEFLQGLRQGDILKIIGPCGNGIDIEDFENYKNIYLIGGGIGIAPLIYLKKYLKLHEIKSKLIIGIPSDKFLHYLNDIRIHDITIFTEDGSFGLKGFPTDILDSINSNDSLIVACGPEAMYKTLKNKKIKAKVLMEQVMACGFGACLGCVIETKQGYKRVCVDGPVFDLDEVIFND